VRRSYFGDIRGNDCRLGEEPQHVVEPWGKVGFDVLGQIQAGDGAELDAQGLQEDGDDVGEEHHDEQLVLVGRAGGHVRRVISCAARLVRSAPAARTRGSGPEGGINYAPGSM